MEVGLTTWGFSTVIGPWNYHGTQSWRFGFIMFCRWLIFRFHFNFQGCSLISSINKFSYQHQPGCRWQSKSTGQQTKNNQPQLGPKFKFPKEVSCIMSLPRRQHHNLNELLFDNHVTQLEATLPTTKSTLPSKPFNKKTPFKQEIHIGNHQF